MDILHVFALDRNHINFIKRFYPDVKSVRFLPNGGAAEGEQIEYDKRSIDVIYCGSCQDEVKTFPVISYLQDQGIEFYRNTIGITLGNPNITTEDAIEYYFISNSIEYLMTSFCRSSKPLQYTLKLMSEDILRLML